MFGRFSVQAVVFAYLAVLAVIGLLATAIGRSASDPWDVVMVDVTIGCILLAIPGLVAVLVFRAEGWPAVAKPGPLDSRALAAAEPFETVIEKYHWRFLTFGDIGVTSRVLDVGCGTGRTTRNAAWIAKHGTVLGVDLDGSLVRQARALARRAGAANATFKHCDPASHRFPAGWFDIVISRTGVMAFTDPVGAFTNLARALRPGGTLALMVWQHPEKNQWLREFHAPDEPWPVSLLSDPDRLRTMLTEAGYTDIEIGERALPLEFGTRRYDSAAWFVRARSQAERAVDPLTE
jgi:SAM-dependent methyltransferase